MCHRIAGKHQPLSSVGVACGLVEPDFLALAFIAQRHSTDEPPAPSSLWRLKSFELPATIALLAGPSGLARTACGGPCIQTNGTMAMSKRPGLSRGP